MIADAFKVRLEAEVDDSKLNIAGSKMGQAISKSLESHIKGISKMSGDISKTGKLSHAKELPINIGNIGKSLTKNTTATQKMGKGMTGKLGGILKLMGKFAPIIGVVAMVASVLTMLAPLIGLIKLIVATLQLLLYPIVQFMLVILKPIIYLLLKYFIIPFYQKVVPLLTDLSAGIMKFVAGGGAGEFVEKVKSGEFAEDVAAGGSKGKGYFYDISTQFLGFFYKLGYITGEGIQKVLGFFHNLGAKFGQWVQDRGADFGRWLSNTTQKWEELKNNITEKIDTLKTSSIEKWEELKRGVIEKINVLKTDTISKFEGMKNGVIEKIDIIKNYIPNSWEEIKNKIFNKIEEIKTWITNKWIEIKTSTLSPLESVLKWIEDTWVSISDAIKSPLKAIFDFISKIKLPSWLGGSSSRSSSRSKYVTSRLVSDRGHVSYVTQSTRKIRAQEGGIAMYPTDIKVAEREPEIIIPLSKLDRVKLPSDVSKGNTTINFNIQKIEKEVDMDRLIDKLQTLLYSNNKRAGAF